MSRTGMCSTENNKGCSRPARKLPRNGEIVRKGYLKKMKVSADEILKKRFLKLKETMKKKYFVLRAETSSTQASLDYYDSEKKYERHPNNPKKSIVLKSTFNINKREDTKYKYVVALYTKTEVLSLIMDSEEERNEWLKDLLFLEYGDDIPEGGEPQPQYEFIWQVEMANRELGGNKNITGPYLLCLTEKGIKLVKTGSNVSTDKLDNIEFSIHSIRCCGDFQTFFYLEVGTATVTGPGNLWMQVEDNNIASNMHATVLQHCMKYSSSSKGKSVKDDLSQYQQHNTSRIRSPSVSEISRPNGYCHSGILHSLPYRTRTNSEGMQPLNSLLRCSILDPNAGIQPHHLYKDLHAVQQSHLAHLMGSPIVSPTSDSTGSSISLDNVDGHDHPHNHHHNVTINDNHSGGHNDDYMSTTLGQHNDSYVTWNAKRKEDEQLNNYLTDNNLSINNNSYQMTRKISPNSFKSSSPSQASFLDVHSPCGSSPMEHNSAYFPMSPVSVENKNRILNGCLSVSHSRGSSITEDGFDTGYMDMEMNKRNARHHNSTHHDTFGSIMSPGGSTGSMTSGTPSKDLNYSSKDLHYSYLTPAEEEQEDDTTDNRQKRAYSVGSRPENLKNKINKSDTQDFSRTRAFSVGSKLGPKPRHLPVSSSQSSVEHSEDMMEMDFSRNTKSRKQKSSEKLGVPPSSSISSAASSYSTAEGSSYLDSPRASPRMGSQSDLIIPSPPRSSSLLHRAFGRSPPKGSSIFHAESPPNHHSFRNLGRVLETPPGYVEMKPSTKSGDMSLVHGSNSSIISPGLESLSLKTPVSPSGSTTSTLTNLTSCSPPKPQPFRIKTGTPPKFIDEEEDDPYMDMAPGKVQKLPSQKSTKASDYMEMDLKRKPSLEEDINRTDPIVTKKPPDRSSWSGSFRSSKHSSLDDSKADDYMNMDVGHKKDRRKTQPITISSSPVSTSRKMSASTPPKANMFLQLSNNSPARSTRRKSSLTRRESRESSTPTIFPFSLGSPAISPAESESPSGVSRVSEPLESVREVADSNDYVNFAPDAVSAKKKRRENSADYVEMQPTPSSSNPSIAPRALATLSQGKTLEQVQKKLAALGLSKSKKVLPVLSEPTPPPPVKEITYESLDLDSSSSSSSSLASRSHTSYATIDHTKTAPNHKTAPSSFEVSSIRKN